MNYLPTKLSIYFRFLGQLSFVAAFFSLFAALVIIAIISSINPFIATYLSSVLFGVFSITMAGFISTRYQKGKKFEPEDLSNDSDNSLPKTVINLSALFYNLTGVFQLSMIYMFSLFGLFLMFVPIIVVFGS